MGNRAQVCIADTGVWLYTHSGGGRIAQDVAAALAREARWNDPEYLARIIFDQMVGDDDSTTGYGIDTAQHGDVSRVIEVDCADRVVTDCVGGGVVQSDFRTFVADYGSDGE